MSSAVSKNENDDEHHVDWESSDDPSNPQNYGIPKKWAITMLVAVLTLNT